MQIGVLTSRGEGWLMQFRKISVKSNTYVVYLDIWNLDLYIWKIEDYKIYTILLTISELIIFNEKSRGS